MMRGRRLTALLPCLLILSLRNLLRADGELTPPNTVFFQALSGPLFFDLVNDPNEYSPVNLDTINSDYSDAYSTLLSRAEYWSDIVKTPEEPDATVKKKTWKAAGGIVPWLTDVNYTTTVIEQKYSYTDAPNIIFVLVDDWGWNDVGFRSSYMSWTTPNIDKLAAEGVNLNNYFTSYLCTPTRGALLTGRYPIRLGLAEAGDGAELPLSEITLAQELKSAGYNTYMVGKWHLGFSTIGHTPAERGFDSSYTYWNGFVDYWTKESSDYLDLHDGNDLVTDESEISAELHNGYLMATKAEDAIKDHVENHADEPMFLYYAMQLIHGVWSAPDVFKERCGTPSLIDGMEPDDYTRNVTYEYCALNLMLDEAIGNLTCALETYGMAKNTVLVVVSDNGGEQSVPGNSLPFIGSKGSYFRGGLSATGLVHSQLLPKHARGTSYDGQMHVTDWLPTLMGLATDNQWTGSLVGAELDGVDQWAALTTPGSTSPRSEIVHYHNGSTVSSIQIDMIKLNQGDVLKPAGVLQFNFQEDLFPELAATSCENPSLMDYTTILPIMLNPLLYQMVQQSYIATKMSILVLGLMMVYMIVTCFQSRKSKTETEDAQYLNETVHRNYDSNNQWNEACSLKTGERADI